jgi:hypothetical protein
LISLPENILAANAGLPLEGKHKTRSLGVYPDVPLKLARERRDAARNDVAARMLAN